MVSERRWVEDIHCILVFLPMVCRFISYPRTETNIFPSSVDLNHLIQQQTQDPNWGGTDQLLTLATMLACSHGHS